MLPVSDGAILRILHGLMTVEGRSLTDEKIRERLSYRSLDVESIGSVYETVMGFTADARHGAHARAQGREEAAYLRRPRHAPGEEAG